MRRFPIAVLPLLLFSGEAFARVGGGQGFSGGGGGGGGGGFSGGGSGGGGGDLVWFLFWLLLNHPVIGIPVTVLIFVIVLRARAQAGNPTRYRSPVPVTPRRSTDLDGLRAADPGFSRPLFLDFAQLVYTRGLTLRGQREPLRPYFSDTAQDALEQGSAGLEATRDLIFGATRLLRVGMDGGWTTLVVHFEVNFTEIRGGAPKQLYAADRWTFRRREGVTSPGPEAMHSLGCPSCGSTGEPRKDGTCPSCDAVRTGGALQWEVAEIRPIEHRPLDPLALQLGGGVEPGTRNATVLAPDLLASRRAFEARHPDFDWADFKAQVTQTFTRLQAAWSSGKWETARPFETDALFQVHRFWIDRYAAAHLRNRCEDVTVSAVQLAAIDTDRYYETLTVRVFATMRDWTEDSGGAIVSGSKREPRTFTEYWTFLRTVGGKAKSEGARCPSCGAPLDKVSAAGVCGYCDAKITTGEFGWVLSRIEQDDVYEG